MFGKDSNTLNISAELLGLSDVEVTKVSPNLKSYQIVIQVQSTKKEISCRFCGKPTKGHGVGRTLRLRHLPILNQDTLIEITPRRGKCQSCDGNPTSNENMDWYEEKSKYTKAFEHRMLFDLVNSTVADVSRKNDVDYHTIENLIDRYIEQEVDFSRVSKLGVLGIDEISMKKGHRDFVTVITYRFDNKVHILGIVDGREKSDISAFFAKIPPHLTKTIKAVCSDLYEGYLNACKEIFGKKIPIVADRFHVRKLYRKSLVNLRKAELIRLRKVLSEQEYKSLADAIKLLRKSKDYFTDEEKVIVAKLFSYSPKLKLAYQFSRELTAIFDSHINMHEAKKKITEWVKVVTESELTCFNVFLKTLAKHKNEIANYFTQRYNSGFVEGFNNKIKVIKRRCYGLSSAVKLFQRIIIDTMGLERFATGMV